MSKLKGNNFKLRCRISYKNSFARELHGSIESRAGGCQIKYRLQVPLSVRIFMGLWLAFVFFVGIVIAIQRPSAALIPTGMFFFGLGLTFIGQKLGSGNEQKMEDFVRKIAVGIKPSQH